MRLYIGNKMVGKENFNEEWFDQTAFMLRSMGHEVFSPAERDRGAGMVLAGTDGSLEAVGPMARRECLRADWDWIGQHSEGMVVGPDWLDSPGTISEMACHFGLYLPVWRYGDFISAHRASHPDIALNFCRMTPFMDRLKAIART